MSVTLDKLDERVTSLEKTLSALKIAATVLGVSGALLFGYVTFVHSEARAAQVAARTAAEEVKAAKDDALEGLRAAASQEMASIDTALDAELPGLGRALINDPSSCKEVPASSCDRDFNLRCPSGYYAAGFWNRGGNKPCARKLYCCKPASQGGG